MKNPTILMNEKDFEVLKSSVESKTTITVGNNPTYEGVPIKPNNIIQRGNIIVYDAFKKTQQDSEVKHSKNCPLCWEPLEDNIIKNMCINSDCPSNI